MIQKTEETKDPIVMKREEILKLRGRDLDTAVCEALGWQWGDLDGDKCLFAPAPAPAPTAIDAVDGWGMMTRTYCPGYDDAALPDYHADLNLAWELGDPHWAWSFDESFFYIRPRGLTRGLGVVLNTGTPRVIQVLLAVCEFNNVAVAYATGRCLAWLLAQEQE